MSFTQHFVKCKVCIWVLLNTLLQFHKFFLILCIFVVFNNVNTVRSEMWVWGFPNHSCQKFFTNHSSSTRDLTRFLAFVIWKTQYSHFLLTVLSHCISFMTWYLINIGMWKFKLHLTFFREWNVVLFNFFKNIPSSGLFCWNPILLKLWWMIDR